MLDIENKYHATTLDYGKFCEKDKETALALGSDV